MPLGGWEQRGGGPRGQGGESGRVQCGCWSRGGGEQGWIGMWSSSPWEEGWSKWRPPWLSGGDGGWRQGGVRGECQDQARQQVGLAMAAKGGRAQDMTLSRRVGEGGTYGDKGSWTGAGCRVRRLNAQEQRGIVSKWAMPPAFLPSCLLAPSPEGAQVSLGRSSGSSPLQGVGGVAFHPNPLVSQCLYASLASLPLPA